jgi:DHA2 family multidrug resistance protein
MPSVLSSPSCDAVDAERVPPVVWAGFAVMCMGMFMAILDVQVVATSLPTIQSALDIHPDRISWIQTAYLIAEVVAIPLTGFLVRAFTMRWLFVLATAVFTAASAGCAASVGFASLIPWRIVQGLAGGILIPLVFSAVFLLFPKRVQSLAASVAGVIAVLAPTLGPIAGGWITETYSWHWLFLVNIVPGAAVVTSAVFLVPRGRAERRRLSSLDALSVLLMAVALATLEVAFKEAPTRGWTDAAVVGLFLVTLLSGAIFVRRTLWAPEPVVDLQNLADRRFAVGCLLSFLLGIALFGSVYLMPVFLAFVRGHGALRIGQVMLVTGVAQLIAAPVAAALEDRVDSRLLAAFGFALFAAGCAMSMLDTRETDFAGMFWPQVVRGTAIMFCFLAPTQMALGHLPPERVPDASALFNLMRNLGGAIGIALVDTVLYGRSPIYAEALAGRLQAGDPAAAAVVGLPLDLVAAQVGHPPDAMVLSLIRPLVEKAAFMQAVDEAWTMLAVLMAVGLMALPFVLPRVLAGRRRASPRPRREMSVPSVARSGPRGTW